MNLVSFVRGNTHGFGVVKDTGVVDCSDRVPGCSGLKDVIAGPGLGTLKSFARAPVDIALKDVTLLPVIPDPDKIICVGVNHGKHLSETGRPATERPMLFTRFASSQVAHGTPIVRPTESTMLDFEGELAVVIGGRGRRIPKYQALSFVAGYSCYNDGSVRDWQRHTSQFTPGKNVAGTGAFGPWLVTAYEIPDLTALTLETRVNGAVMQSAEVSDFIFDVSSLIEYCSTFTELSPGDVIVTGTAGGVGAFREPPVWLKEGDLVEVEISQIGVLRNRVVDEA